MGNIITAELLKYLGIGIGSSGGLVLFALLWLHVRVKNNRGDIMEVKEECKDHGEELREHNTTLVEISTNQKHMMKTQTTMSEKIDKLIELHMES